MNKNNSPSTRLFIGGLPFRFTEGELLGLFAPFGRIISLKIMHTPWGKSRGLGFLEFDNLESAISAKNKMHNYKVMEDRSIIVDFAEPDPFNTPEGKLRHQEAVVRNPKKFRHFEQKDSKTHKSFKSKFNSNSSGSSFKPKSTGFKPKPKYGENRQSVYDSRTHHSRVGAKFSSRHKKK